MERGDENGVSARQTGKEKPRKSETWKLLPARKRKIHIGFDKVAVGKRKRENQTIVKQIKIQHKPFH